MSLGLHHEVLGLQHMNRGNDVPGPIFGSKDIRRAGVQNAAAQSGLDPSLLKKMLPMMATLITGHMPQQIGAGIRCFRTSRTGATQLCGMLES